MRIFVGNIASAFNLSVRGQAQAMRHWDGFAMRRFR
jgi:hypothetical protein